MLTEWAVCFGQISCFDCTEASCERKERGERRGEGASETGCWPLGVVKTHASRERRQPDRHCRGTAV